MRIKMKKRIGRKEKIYKKYSLLWISVIALVVLDISVASVSAYFSDREEKRNRITVGDSNIEIVEEFAKKINSHIIGIINRSNLIQDSELDAKTVVEKYPSSDETNEYKKLASNILNNNNYSIPDPMNDEEFEKFFKSFLKK